MATLLCLQSPPRTFLDLFPICFPPGASGSEFSPSFSSSLCPLDLPMGLFGGLQSPLALLHLAALGRDPQSSVGLSAHKPTASNIVLRVSLHSTDEQGSILQSLRQ